MDYECCTILLIYNEKENIIPLTTDILKVYKKNSISGEVLLLDDGSTDGSADVCDQLVKKYKNVRVIHHPHNLGRSFAIQRGFKDGLGEVLIIMDGDYQYEPKEIPKFLATIKEGFDVVSGYRNKRADTFIRRFISTTYNRWIIQRRFNLKIKDQNSGFKAFRAAAARNLDFEPEGFLGLHRFILPLASIKGYSITEIPIVHYDRPAGKSYIKFYTVPFITMRDYRKFKKKYLKSKPQSEPVMSKT